MGGCLPGERAWVVLQQLAQQLQVLNDLRVHVLSVVWNCKNVLEKLGIVSAKVTYMGQDHPH